MLKLNMTQLITENEALKQKICKKFKEGTCRKIDKTVRKHDCVNCYVPISQRKFDHLV